MISYFRQLGFDGPFPGGNHLYMQKDKLRIRVPNPHQTDIDRNLLMKILQQGGLTREEWERL